MLKQNLGKIKKLNLRDVFNKEDKDLLFFISSSYIDLRGHLFSIPSNINKPTLLRDEINDRVLLFYSNDLSNPPSNFEFYSINNYFYSSTKINYVKSGWGSINIMDAINYKPISSEIKFVIAGSLYDSSNTKKSCFIAFLKDDYEIKDKVTISNIIETNCIIHNIKESQDLNIYGVAETQQKSSALIFCIQMNNNYNTLTYQYKIDQNLQLLSLVEITSNLFLSCGTFYQPNSIFHSYYVIFDKSLNLILELEDLRYITSKATKIIKYKSNVDLFISSGDCSNVGCVTALLASSNALYILSSTKIGIPASEITSISIYHDRKIFITGKYSETSSNGGTPILAVKLIAGYILITDQNYK